MKIGTASSKYFLVEDNSKILFEIAFGNVSMMCLGWFEYLSMYGGWSYIYTYIYIIDIVAIGKEGINYIDMLLNICL